MPPVVKNKESKKIRSFKNIIRKAEGYRNEAYKPVATEKFYTIGYGHYGEDVKPDQKITKKKAESLLDKDVRVRVKEINNLIPEFNKFPSEVQDAIFSEYYRGSIRQSPNTVDLINAGEYSKAAEEFLKNKQYENAEALGIPGIRPRMEAVRDALLSMGIQSRQEGGPIEAGKPYLVGEDGPELIVPAQDGTVVSNEDTEARAAVSKILADAGVGSYQVPQQSASLPGADLYVPRDKTPKRKVKYVAFDDPKAPRIAVPEEFAPEQVQDYMKSEEVEAQMYDQGYLYKYGLQPSYYKDNSDLDDWALTAGIKSGYDNLKAIGTGALYTVADVFGSEENMAKFEKMRQQYNQDAAVHIFKEGENPSGVESRITSIEDALESEAKLSSFLDWAAFNTGAGATTMIPIIMASAVGAGAGIAAAPFTGGASLAATGASISGMMAAYSMGVGEATGAQLDRSGDSNAALSLAAGIPYAAAERYLGTSFMLNRLFAKKYGADVVEDIVKKTTIKELSEKKIKNSIIKEVGKGFGKQFVGEGITEAIQESITSTVAISSVELFNFILSITFIAALSDSEYSISISFIFNSFDQSY